jgi:hypothetical protein
MPEKLYYIKYPTPSEDITNLKLCEVTVVKESNGVKDVLVKEGNRVYWTCKVSYFTSKEEAETVLFNTLTTNLVVLQNTVVEFSKRIEALSTHINKLKQEQN